MASMTKAKALEKELQDELEQLKKLQADMRKSVGSRQQLESQLRENQIVKDELGLLKPSNTVYKLIGPALVKQDLTEAKQTVDKRLEFINKEIERCEAVIKDLEGKSEQKKEKLVKLQTSLQAQLQTSFQKQKLK
ncbi:prefoldin subunit 6-like [Corticium candelabrum]|uniref:prefoldin subunit 6-like n=1 Tax=Corticium candelabrum TaxID=121492 RepID=UPI002E2715E4|nr:prefoldin subunit 6-like [Corticium candelabrum]